MPQTRRTFTEMVDQGVRYLAENTDVSFFGDGSVARALVESVCLEIQRLQDFASFQFQNSFLSTANGVYLDLFGEMLGTPRIANTRAAVLQNDQAVRFYVQTGRLAQYLPNPDNSNLGLIPQGTTVSNRSGSAEFTVLSDVSFPRNARSVFVSVVSTRVGSSSNVGVNQLTNHNLGINEVLVTNDVAIASGADVESDEDYRFRLSRAMTARFGANATAIELAAMAHPDVSRAQINQYARGAGTFDVLIVPVGNRLTPSSKRNIRRAIEEVVAFGISPEIREPEYREFKVSVQLRFQPGTESGRTDVLRRNVETAVLTYMGSIPMGGELVINRLEATVLGVSQEILDVRIIELCVDGRPQTLRNLQLRTDEVFTPAPGNSVEVL